MRIVSLVPSWTETLLEASADVGGRTRFCIHPSDKIPSIPAVGGTKAFDLEKVRGLKPDLIILDREENVAEMFDQASQIAPRVHVSHVTHVNEMPRELRALAQTLDTEPKQKLESFAARFEQALAKPPASEQPERIVYCIWKDPWMAVGQNTFIASMLAREGLVNLWPMTPAQSSAAADKYPKFELSDVPKDAVLLLSSEPYPFAKKKPETEGRLSILVDGESYSWFGVRALRHLESGARCQLPRA